MKVKHGEARAASSGTTFQVAFHPGATGLRSALVSIACDDPVANPVTFAIQGTGLNSRAIAVTGNGGGHHHW